MEFRILGPLEVGDGGRRVAIPGAKPRTLLGVLLLHQGEAVSVDRLIDELWGDEPPETATAALQVHVSNLRKALGRDAVVRAPAGYAVPLEGHELDLRRFERLVAEARTAAPDQASGLLRAALDLWRGEPEVGARRLGELRRAALEARIDADLELGRADAVIPELQELVEEEPLQERLRARLVLALYRSGRQAEALAAYREARERLMDGFGIDPGPALKELERRILAQDPELAPARPQPSGSAQRTVLAAPTDESGVARLAGLTRPQARLPGQELIMARLVRSEPELAAALDSLEVARRAGESTRVAAFTSADPASDIVRLAVAYDVELVLLEARAELNAPKLPDEVVRVLEESPADVGLVAGQPVDWGRRDGIFVPFGGTEHDWAALELGTWLASAAGVPLRLVGVRADPVHGRRDASRLLANASLAAQRLVDISAEPLLVDPSPDALVEAVQAATLVVVGLSSRWRTEGFGAVRSALLRRGRSVVVVHAGPRPSGLAPRDARTRFTWSLAT